MPEGFRDDTQWPQAPDRSQDCPDQVVGWRCADGALVARRGVPGEGRWVCVVVQTYGEPFVVGTGFPG